MAMLIGMSEGYRGKTYEVKPPKVTIGRTTTNSLSFDHSSISSHHCVIKRENRQFLLRDLESTNGTRVNGREITETILKPKDVLQIGSLEFVFDADEGEIEQKDVHNFTQVEDLHGSTQVPKTFNSISPFHSRKDNRSAWLVVVGVIAVITVVILIIFLVFLIRAG